MAIKIIGTSPSDNTDAATKAYVDAVASNVSAVTGFQSVTTAAGTTTLTSSSPMMTQFTGTTTQTCVLPDATTLTVGRQFILSNRSTGSVQVNDNSSGAVQTLFSTSEARLTLTANGTAAGTWDVTYLTTGGSVGMAATAYVSTLETTSSTSYTDLTTTTDTVTVTVGSSGSVMVFIQAGIQITPTAALVSFALSGANTQAASDNYAVESVNGQIQAGLPSLLTGLTAGSTTFKLKYRVISGTGTFFNRRISVIPINNTNLWAGQTNNLEGSFSSLPAAGTAGRLYTATDTGLILLDNGASWDRTWIGNATPSPGAVPTSGWTAVNLQTGTTWVQDKDAMLFTVPTAGSADNWQYQYRAYPTPPFTLTTYMDITFKTATLASSTVSAKACIIISDGTKLITGGALFYNGSTPSAPWRNTGWNFGAFKYTNLTTFSSSYNTYSRPLDWIGEMPKWYRVTDDGTNLTWQCSLNGNDWMTLASEARTAFLTPSRIGIGASNWAGDDFQIRVRSWNGVA